MNVNKDARIKIGFIIWTLEAMSGSEKVVYDIVRKLDKNLYSIILITFRDGPVREKYEKIGVKVYSIHKKSRFDFKFVLFLRAILKKEEIQLINAHHFSPMLYSLIACIGTNIKTVYTEHSRWQIEQLKFAKKVLNKLLLVKSDAIVAISNQIKSYYLYSLKISPEKIFFIPNGVDLDLFRKKPQNTIRAELKLENDEKIIGIVATIRPEKNHETLVRAFANVLKKVPRLRLVIIGDDHMDGKVHRLTVELGVHDRTLFLGHRVDIPELISAFDIFCLPSIYEGMPLTILEAMALGTPVVGADVLGINELIQNKENGMLFESYDEYGLAEIIIELLQNQKLCIQLAEQGKKLVKKNYSLDNSMSKYNELFFMLSR